ncbi:LOW QUALITY PROTEIN: uncharacterized protein C20orf194-like [Acanthaster planci]|uniref:LOW QUALITY PROTEIN: uncharacterized protein C20orf194-like n=1 Tax=Acanthaster planci TaxID=133434 RepID=A0A8B7XJ63_ACAPL|nr:LOW QUALITY PROTEIN: uncharacterized protein C20orf194-like [Acanthaster planci]
MPPTRPSSARKNVPQATFSAFASCARLRHVQSLLREPSDQDSSATDAVLCILGIDSRYNEGCRELANYLLFGFLDLRKEESDRTGIGEDIADDLLILVKKDSIHVHYMPADHAYVIPYIAHWHNLHLHCLTDAEHKENEDAAENYKVLSFIEMVRDCSRIGVPYFARDHVQTFDHFAVEKWPIIQTYGLEDFGTGGFFTMKHEVVDMTESLSRIYDIVDPVSLEKLVTQQLPLFERQWNALLTNVDISFKDRSTFGELLESTVVEPLKSFYSHGRVASPRSDTRKPFVFFGQRSGSTTAPDTDGTVGTSGVSKSAAKHMICQAVGPKSPLCCGRTYFFGSGHTPYPVTGGTPRAPRPPKTDIELLSILYKVAIDAVLASIQAYGQSTSEKEVEAVCRHTLMEGCADHMLNVETYATRMQFSLEAFDHFGSLVSLEESKPSPLVKMASLRLTDIVSLEHHGSSLGSLLFSESFLDSRIAVSHSGQRPTIDSQCLILTSHVPRYVSWAVDVADKITSKLRETFTKSLDVFGKVLLTGESIVAFGSKELSAAHEGQLYICEKGLVFQDSRHGVVIFPKSYFEEMQFFDGDSSSVIAALVITYRHSLQQYLPMHYHNQGDMVMFTFTPKTRAHRAFYSEVISLWLKTSDDPLLKLVDKVPEYFVAPHTELQMQYAQANKLNVDARPISVAMANLHHLKRFLDHFAASSVGDVPIPDKDLACVLNQKPADQVDDSKENGEIVATIITGIPGSHKDNLCNILTNMAKEQSRWVTLRQPYDSADAFSTEALQTSLSAVLLASKKRNVRAATGGRKKMRVLIATPGDVVRAITCHPDLEVAQLVRIGAVTACVDAHNTFMAHRYTFPKLLDQCAQGWVNNVLFTSSTPGPDPVLSMVQELLRRVNPGLAFILANKGEISRSEDVDMILSESLFNTPSMIRARHLLCPGWLEGRFGSGALYPAMTAVVLKFSQPLERGKLLVKLRDLRDQAASRNSFTGNVYCVTGRTKFTDSDQLMELQSVTLSSYISLTPVPETVAIRPPSAPRPPPHRHPTSPCPPMLPSRQVPAQPMGPTRRETIATPCLVFTGCDLEAGQLKEWLRGCSRQRPTKKPLKTKQSLTKEERKRIHVKHHLDALPQGWFYNGSQYVSMAGEKTDTHPDMDAFINEYLKQANKIVEEYNARIESEDYKDLFAQ